MRLVYQGRAAILMIEAEAKATVALPFDRGRNEKTLQGCFGVGGKKQKGYNWSWVFEDDL